MEIYLYQPYSFCQEGKRANQEDARFPDSDEPHDFQPAFVVCDGVGGLDKGEVASRTVADAIGRYMEDVDLAKPFEAKDFSNALTYAYDCLGQKMRHTSNDMATTMTFVCFHKGGVFCAHIGDSRIYHIRPHVGILYRSDDHSLVNVLVHSGNLTPQEAIDHAQSNVITRCIGYIQKGQEIPPADTYQVKDVEEGDYFFMCTDGVLHQIDDDELVAIFSSDISDKEKIDRIAELSKDSSDNNTAYMLGVRKVIRENTEINEAIGSEGTATVLIPMACRNEVVEEVTPKRNQSVKAILADFWSKISHKYGNL